MRTHKPTAALTRKEKQNHAPKHLLSSTAIYSAYAYSLARKQRNFHHNATDAYFWHEFNKQLPVKSQREDH